VCPWSKDVVHDKKYCLSLRLGLWVAKQLRESAYSVPFHRRVAWNVSVLWEV